MPGRPRGSPLRIRQRYQSFPRPAIEIAAATAKPPFGGWNAVRAGGLCCRRDFQSPA